MSYKDGKSKLYKKTAKSEMLELLDMTFVSNQLELKNSIGDLNLQIKSMKNDMLKMIEAIEKNEMHITQLNWKLNNHTGKSYDEELDH